MDDTFNKPGDMMRDPFREPESILLLIELRADNKPVTEYRFLYLHVDILFKTIRINKW